MKRTNRYGAVVCCDVLKRVETEEEIIDLDQCDATYHTNSVSSVARAQAKDRKWVRTQVKYVRWPGLPPMADNKKVDVCPNHAKLVMTVDEYKAKKKADREAAKAARAAARRAAPKKPRKKKQATQEADAGTPF